MRTKPVWARPSRDDEPPSAGRQAVDGAVDAPVVEEHQRPGQPLAGAHEQRLVDRVGVERLAGGAAATGETRAGAVTGTSRRPTNSQASRTPERHHRETAMPMVSGATTCVGLLGRPEDRRQPVDQREGLDQQEAGDDRADGQHDHRHGHDRRRLVRVDAVLPPRAGRRTSCNISRVM